MKHIAFATLLITLAIVTVGSATKVATPNNPAPPSKPTPAPVPPSAQVLVGSWRYTLSYPNSNVTATGDMVFKSSAGGTIVSGTATSDGSITGCGLDNTTLTVNATGYLGPVNVQFVISNSSINITGTTTDGIHLSGGWSGCGNSGAFSAILFAPTPS